MKRDTRHRAAIALLLAVAMIPVLAACGGSGSADEAADYAADPVKIVIEVRGYGDVEAELYPGAAPATVEHFLELVRAGFYDGAGFHRVVPGFVVQAGEVRDTSMPIKAVKGEFAANGYDDPLTHALGTLSMARRDDNYDSATTQFFITLADRPDLDGNYAAFGRVTAGMDAVLRIAEESPADARGSVAEGDRVVIDAIRIIEDNGQEKAS